MSDLSYSEEIRYSLGHKFKVVDGFPMAYSQTGEEYYLIEGKEPSERQAAIILALRIGEYISDKFGSVYIRTIDISPIEKTGLWGYYCRLVASDRPIKWNNLREYEEALS